MNRYRREPRIDAWKPDEDAYLVRHYALKPAAEIAAYLGRSVFATRNRAFRLGIQRDRAGEPARAEADSWTEKELEYLDRQYGVMTLRALSAELRRTVYSIRAKAIARGLKADGRNRKGDRPEAADPAKSMVMGVIVGDSVEFLASCYRTRPATVRRLLREAGLESDTVVRLPDTVRDRLLNLLEQEPADVAAVVRGLNAVRRLLLKEADRAKD